MHRQIRRSLQEAIGGKIAAAQGREVAVTPANLSVKMSAGEKEKEKEATHNPDVQQDIAEELSRTKKEVKELRRLLSEMRRDADARIARYEHELKALRQEHRELADLRELVFNSSSENPKGKTENRISYPYETRKRTVVFGGHDTFLKAIRPLLPNVKFVDVGNYGFNPEIVRNADVVWIQNNCISHTQYGNILRITRLYGIQIRYFAYGSAEKCAEQLAVEDRK